MLNEIFKGMDNAAEKINENFKKLLISMGTNENGRWIRIPIIKLQICMHDKNLAAIDQMRGQLAGSPQGTWSYPQEFSGIPLAFASVRNDNRWASVQPREDYLTYRQWGFITNNVEIETIIIAIGFYE